MKDKAFDYCISIIVPIYNSEKYLEECIESIVNQSYKNLEIILVDDGSTDNSFDICLNYTNTDNRVKYYKKENTGVSSTRNFGINVSTGSFIMFVDSDDILKKNCVESLANIIDDADMASCGISLFFPDRAVDCCNPKDIKISLTDINELYLDLEDNYFFNAVYAKLYRASIIKRKDIKYDERYSIYEDRDFVFRYLKYCSKISFLQEAMYSYRQTEGPSLVKKYNSNALDAFENMASDSEWFRDILIKANMMRFDQVMFDFFLTKFKAYIKHSKRPYMLITKEMINNKIFLKACKRVSLKGETPKRKMIVIAIKAYLLIHGIAV